MKIAVIADYNIPIKTEGKSLITDFILHLMAELMEEQDEIKLFAHPDSQVPFEFVSLNSGAIDWTYHTEESAGFKNYIESQHAYSEVFNMICRRDFDLVLNFSEHPWPIFQSAHLNVPFIHMLNTKPIPALQSAIKLNQQENQLYTCPSFYLQSLWSHHCQISEVNSLGINMDQYSFGKVTEENRAIWMGDIARGTGLEDALNAAKQNNWNLCIAGRIKDKEYFDYIIEPYLNDETFFLDYDKQELQWQNYLKRSEVAFFTHENKDTSRQVLQALSSGVPVAAYPMDAVSELIPENVGKIAPKKDIGALAYSGKVALKSNREDCREFVKQQFNLDQQVDQFQGLIHKLVDSKKKKKDVV